eukprot:TRINITY_DN16739_c0_g1_i1.p2 TRINITY_DN16739_c0_g1~~TRINITY_DN16739_c0_g1_i1.p2  ORF type:complete len:102 (-),score=13.32 TRINITY_DN16739_c0_g1_i1:37-342(-)
MKGSNGAYDYLMMPNQDPQIQGDHYWRTVHGDISATAAVAGVLANWYSDYKDTNWATARPSINDVYTKLQIYGETLKDATGQDLYKVHFRVGLRNIPAASC